MEDLKAFAESEFGPENVRADHYVSSSEPNDFLVLTDEGYIESSLQVSSVISTVPATGVGIIFVAPELAADARKKIKAQLDKLL